MKNGFKNLCIIGTFLLAVSCSTGSSNSTTDTSPSSIDTDISADVLANNSFAYTITINLSNKEAALDSGTEQDFSSDSVSFLDGAVTVEVPDSGYAGIKITSTSTDLILYELSGSLSGTLTVDSDDTLELYLNEASIEGDDGPALYLTGDGRAFVVTADGSENTLSDSTDNGKKAALFTKSILILDGLGTLEVDAYHKHGIYSDDYLRMAGGTLTVNVDEDAVGDGIRTVNAFIMDDGTLTVNASGSETGDESKGIKVEGDDADDSGAGLGYVVIHDGEITITSVGKAITAGWDIDEDAEDADTTYDPNPDVLIDGGTITITTTGTPREDSDADGSLSPEGIEAKDDMTISGGTITISSTDDGLNAGDALVISGGYIYANASDNDAIDSNGSLTFSGGVIVAIGASSPEGPFDCDTSAFGITGGVIVGIGGATSTPTASYCGQNVMVLNSLGVSSGSVLALRDSSGSCAFAYTMPSTADVIVLSSPEIASGTAYTVYSGGTASSDESFHGLYLPDITYSPGTSLTTLTTSSRVTTYGTTTGPNGK